MNRALSWLFLAFSPTLALAADSSYPNVCIGLRGNGFRIASHFGAVARTVEELGLPDAMAGGSSSNYTMFLTESVAMNPWLPKEEAERRLVASFLIKASPEFLLAFTKEPTIAEAISMATNKAKRDKAGEIAKKVSSDDVFEKILYLIQLALTDPLFAIDLYKLKGSIYVKQLLNPEFKKFTDETSNLKKLLAKETLPEKKSELEAIIKYRQQEASDALGAASKFDVNKDLNLFYRPSVLDHANGVARVWDRAAGFFAGYNFDRRMESRFKRWVSRCSRISANRTFEQVVALDPRCGSEFEGLALDYIAAYNDAFNDDGKTLKNPRFKFRLDDRVSKKFHTFSMTSAVVGESAERYLSFLPGYEKATAPGYGTRFRSSEADLKIGYFGTDEAMKSVQVGLSRPFRDSSGRIFDFSQDFRSKMVLPLGRVKWVEAASSSAAEPGAARPVHLKHLSVGGKPVVSFGGWADPNPVHILKAIDCKTTVTIMTSIKPGNNFGEQVLKKLVPDFDGIQGLDPETIANGRKGDTTSSWGRWRNQANPRSSQNLAFYAADAVYCIHWDDITVWDKTRPFSATMRELIDVGYLTDLELKRRPGLAIPEDVPRTHPVYAMSVAKVDRKDNRFYPDLNRKLFNGCLPPLPEEVRQVR